VLSGGNGPLYHKAFLVSLERWTESSWNWDIWEGANGQVTYATETRRDAHCQSVGKSIDWDLYREHAREREREQVSGHWT